MKSQRGSYRALLRDVPEFRWLWLSRALSSAGDAVQLVALFWLATLTPAPGVGAGVIAFAITIPPAFAGPFVGALVDQVSNRRWLLVAGDVVRFALTLLIPVAFEAGGLYAAAAVAFAQALVGTLFTSSYGAALSEIVGMERLALANGLTMTTNYVVMGIGSAAGGFLTSANLYLPFGVNALTFLISALLVLAVPIARFAVVRAEGTTRARYIRTLGEGWRYTRKNRPLLIYMFLGVMATIGFAPAPVALVILVRKVLGADAAEYGLILALTTAGLAAGAAVAGRLAHNRHQATVMAAGDMAMGLATLGLGWSGSLPLAGAWVFLRSGSNSVSSVPGISLLQKIVPSEFRGRAFTLVGVVSEIPRAAILPVAGFALEALGVRAVYTLMAVFILGSGLVAWLLRYVIEPISQPEAGPQ